MTSDESNLQAIMPNDDIIDDTKLEWSTNSEGVHHSGITNKELPFRNQLCSGTVDPSGLKNVTGKLEVSSGYKKNTSATINAGGTSRNVKEPYVMTSFASFDVEHAKNVKVDNDKAMDQDGSFIATGLAMIGLAQSLEADNMVDLSESVTITADVTGFVMPDITTMASNQVLYMVGVDATDDLDSNPDDMLDQVSSIQEATEQLSRGIRGVNRALSRQSQNRLRAAGQRNQPNL